MIDHPDNPYVKLLVVFGRDDKDLLQAAKGIAQGNILFRGSSVTVDDVKQLQARKPYDAPNWVRTDRAVTFALPAARQRHRYEPELSLYHAADQGQLAHGYQP